MDLTARIEIDETTHPVTFEETIHANEIVGLLGPSGAGKTSIVLALAGLRRVARGAIRMGHQTWTDAERGIHVPPDRRRMGVVFQEDRLFPHLNTTDNVAFGPRSIGVGRSASRRSAAMWLERLDIGHLAERPVTELSGGEGRRVALARALASDPVAVALDEPTTGLDVETRHEIRAMLRSRLRDMGIPTLIVTHDPMDVMVLADRIVVLEEGQVTQRGTVADLTARPRSAWIARLAGTNLWRGEADGESVAIGEWTLHLAEAHHGPVLVTVAPRAVTLSNEPPAGSARNVMQGSIRGLEPLGGRVRVAVDGPVRVIAEITTDAVSALALTDDRMVWASIKATELDVYSA